MADLYEMPTPKPPDDEELDELSRTAHVWRTSTLVPADVRQVIRVQDRVIRALRVELAKTKAKLTSVEAIAAIARDERVAAHEAEVEQGACWGSDCPPDRLASGGGGRCMACGLVLDLDHDGTVQRHEPPDPPV